MRLITNFGRCIAGFSQQQKHVRNLRNYFKSKRIEQQAQASELTNEDIQSIKNSHRMLFVPYVPIVLLSVPCLFFFSTPVDPHFLQSCNLLQYYTSGILCFNAYFHESKMKTYFPFLLGVGLVNCFSGPVSALSPLLLGALSFYFPIVDEKEHKMETEEQQERAKTYLGSQAIFYFLVTLITTLKCYHFWSKEQLQKKLREYERQNTVHFGVQSQMK